ncbi:hypothetical protein MG293_000990 [Ovis ammon polii]|uniref:Uncharacterized protein n=1 Tax=Ovis ammon polii TaxID=230172 RepID=A0AAD4UR84_OVIAM|nr:hypothetical protein MG293_000990 [Ovis ammon polii]
MTTVDRPAGLDDMEVRAVVQLTLRELVLRGQLSSEPHVIPNVEPFTQPDWVPPAEGEFHNWFRVYRAKLEFMPSSVPKSGEGNGHPLQYACLETPTDRGAWQVIVSGVTRVGHDLAAKPPPYTKESEGPGIRMGSVSEDSSMHCPSS